MGQTEDDYDARVENIRPRLVAFFRQRIKIAADVDDLVQTTVVAAYIGRTRFRGLENATWEAWIIGIAKNILKKYLVFRGSQESREVQRGTEFIEPSSRMELSVVDRLLGNNILAYLPHCCSSDEERQVLTWSLQGKEPVDIARLMHLKPETARSHIHRGKGKLIAYLIENAPDMLGGNDEIKAAWEKACMDSNDVLTAAEKLAWAKKKPLDKYRDACLKMAKHIRVSS